MALNNPVVLRRLGGLAGVAFIILFIVGIALEGSEPKLTATPEKIMSFYTSHHSKVLIADLLIAVAFIFFLIWAAVLAAELRAAGRHAGAGALLASIAIVTAISVVAAATEIGVDQAAVHSADPGFVRGGYLIESYLISLIFLLVVAAAAATALTSGGVFPTWYRSLTALVALLAVLGGISVKASGFFSPMGGATGISGLAAWVWVLATSVLLWRAPRSAASSSTLDAPATA